jgi:hypothetical protein
MLAHNQMSIKAQHKARSESLRDLGEQEASRQCTKHVRTFATSYRRISLVLVLVAGLTYQSAQRARADEKPNRTTLKVMTQNVDAGTDFGYLAGLSTTSEFVQGVALTYEEINESNFAPRAAQLAGEIALHRPALVGLQEGRFVADRAASSIRGAALCGGRLVRSIKAFTQ